MIGIWNRVPAIEETVARIEAASLDDIRAFGRSLCRSGAALAVYGPADAAPDLESLQERLAA